MKIVYDWLKDYCGEDIPDVHTFEDLFTFHAFEIDGTEKIEGHDVIDVKVLPDRSSDCLSHRGIARELSTLTGKPLLKDPFREKAELLPKSEKIQITIQSKENCRRFGAALVTGVTIKESPEWLQERLRALGQRSINNVVDATNYVMLSLGQPLHAYDANKLTHNESGWHIGVRMAHDGEEITSLSGDTYVLKETIQLITDAHTDTPISLAGIKGGKYAEIDSATTNILLEAANFNPQITRKASQFLRLQTDASKRFENNLSPEVVAYALKDVVDLVLNIAGGTCEGFSDTYPSPVTNTPVTVSLAGINALLGVTLTTEIVDDIFARLGFTVLKNSNDTWQVIAPFERTDIIIAEDVIAEVGRVYGYEHVDSVVPDAVPLTEYSARHYYGDMIRTTLRDLGLSEVITSSFRKRDDICLQNALASDKGCLRSSLKENIKEALDRNMPNADLLRVRTVEIFEIGTVFKKSQSGKGIEEHISLAIGVRTRQTGYIPKDDSRLLEIKASLEEVLGVALNEEVVQGVLECNLTEVTGTLPVPTEYRTGTKSSDLVFTPFSLYPFVSRDIALWVPEEVTENDIALCIKETAGALLLHTTLFDAFTKDGKVSYAFRLVFQSRERTLNDVEVGEIMTELTNILTSKGYTVR